ncbi:hypothetical protein K488DRAFT_89500 [Vararia minispora EC-137]|uniref:Uncharacterized protein n=1 Tax=Vararia minispora EC-137 TaxID=1314806 RepID=A0ACB8QAD4_9AGAM|nr:hypothetical protein K488DRAFT_89500 [Vararia minispora EC-137]
MVRPNSFDHFYPGYWHYLHYHRRFGIFRRFFWFSFGAFTALAFARYHGYARFSVEDGPGERRWDGARGHWGFCRRVEYRPHLESGLLSPQQSQQVVQPTQEKLLPVPVQAATSQPLPPPPPPPAPGTFVPPVQQRWEAEMREMSRQAGERMTDLSESTIDSMVATLLGLKARLAEHRTQQQHGQQQLPQPSASQAPQTPGPNRRV